MAEYAAVRVAATKPQPLPERLVGRYPRAVRSWRMVVLRYNAWRRANTMAKRRCASVWLMLVAVATKIMGEARIQKPSARHQGPA